MRTQRWTSWTAWSLLGLAFLGGALITGPAPAQAGKIGKGVGAVLYEVTENAVFLDAKGKPTGNQAEVVVRVATAQLFGWVELGTPLCPSEVLLIYPRAKRCAVNAVGTSHVYLQGVPKPGTGPVSGAFSLVVQGDNPSDGPEGVAMTGMFAGQIDLSPALASIPLGYLTSGVFEVDPGPFSQGGSFGFTGTFRLPFSLRPDDSRGRAWFNRAAYYLKDNGLPTRVREDERAIGWPTVRLEIQFQ